ncbi:hypothetical protein [Peribacillus tepidiphilus]|uniref:hypothetical protein n=1 Tax=Peribacillus tepidiphilus TaxID=2652445 RepID=UPI0012926E87|nr:hypothetical protein [Peribacillus tepidiphilus]
MEYHRLHKIIRRMIKKTPSIIFLTEEKKDRSPLVKSPTFYDALQFLHYTPDQKGQYCQYQLQDENIFTFLNEKNQQTEMKILLNPGQLILKENSAQYKKNNSSLTEILPYIMIKEDNKINFFVHIKPKQEVKAVKKKAPSSNNGYQRVEE